MYNLLVFKLFSVGWQVLPTVNKNTLLGIVYQELAVSTCLINACKACDTHCSFFFAHDLLTTDEYEQDFSTN